jgi:hypothetical protein
VREKADLGSRRGVAEGRLFRNGGEAPSKGLAMKPEAARERIITLLGPSPITLDEPGPAADPRRAVRVALLELELAGRVEYFGRPHRLVRERQPNMSRMDSQTTELFSWCSPTAGTSNSSSARLASGPP